MKELVSTGIDLSEIRFFLTQHVHSRLHLKSTDLVKSQLILSKNWNCNDTVLLTKRKSGRFQNWLHRPKIRLSLILWKVHLKLTVIKFWKIVEESIKTRNYFHFYVCVGSYGWRLAEKSLSDVFRVNQETMSYDVLVIGVIR